MKGSKYSAFLKHSVYSVHNTTIILSNSDTTYQKKY